MAKQKNTTAAVQVPFSIVAQKKGDVAEVRIIGYIGWDVSCEDFRSQVDTLLADGVKDVRLYINSGGGVCTDAEEIVNILRKFTGTITGEGGALVASAATYIAVHCKTFEMPENGLFMIHKPQGMVAGTVTQMEQGLQALRNLENGYFDTYRALAKDTADFEAKWNAGDNWMTAAEAKEAGFVTAVTPKIRIDRNSASMIAACGYPKAEEWANAEIRPYTETKLFDMKNIAKLLGLEESATESEIVAAIEAIQSKAKTADEATAQLSQMRDAQIAAIVDAGIAARKFTADKKEHFVNLGKTSGVDALRTTVDMMAADVKPLDVLKQSSPGAASGKKWEELSADERVALRDSDRATYDRLLAAYQKS